LNLWIYSERNKNKKPLNKTRGILLIILYLG